MISKTFSVPITNDTLDEPAESFLVQLTAPSTGHYLGSPSQTAPPGASRGVTMPNPNEVRIAALEQRLREAGIELQE